MIDTPLISIVVPTFNSQATVEVTMASIAAQRFRSFEVVVSDGASNDDTLTIAERYRSRLPALTIDTRPDTGVYQAINLGIARTRGHWILVLGSDDRLHSADTLQEVANVLEQCDEDLVHGDVWVNGPNTFKLPAGSRHAGPMPLMKLTWTNICQQAIFYRRTLFSNLGMFNPNFRIWADWEFNLRAAFRGPIRWVDIVVADYATTGLSSRQGDAAFADELPLLLQRELACRPHERRLWPVQRALLRHARIHVRNKRWLAAALLVRTYGRLLIQRVVPLTWARERSQPT